MIRTDENLQPVGGTFASMRIIGGERPIWVCRYRGHPEHQNKLRVRVGDKEKTRGTNDKTQIYLERLIGMDYAGYVNSVAFGARDDVKTFFRATESERKQVMDSLMGFDLYSAAELVVKGRIRKLAEDIEEMVSAEETLQHWIRSETKMLAELNEKYAQSKSAKSYRQAKAAKRKLMETEVQQDKRLKLLTDRLRDAQGLHDEELSEHEGKLVDYNRWREEKEQRREAARRATFEAERDIKHHKKYVEELKAVPGKCPTCLQKISKAVIRDKINAVGVLIAGLRTEIDKLGMEFELAVRELEAKEEPQEPRSMRCEELAEKIKNLRHAQNGTEAELSQVIKRIKGLKGAVSVILSQRTKLESHIAKRQVKLEGVSEKLKKSRRKLSDLQAVSTAMGNGGIKSFLLEAELPAINAKATHYASRLIGPGAIVRLNATTTLKGGGERERLSVEGVIPGRTNRYASASKGQKLRMDLSLLLAFRDLCASRSVKSFNQLFADEIFDGVDKIGVERVAELLREISQTCPVVLVTHTDRLKQIGDRRIRVIHNGQYAMAEEN